MVEGARLEIVYAVSPYRGFESPPLRQMKMFAVADFFIFEKLKSPFGPKSTGFYWENFSGFSMEHRRTYDMKFFGWE